ncbi:MAG: hypothetical protein ACU0DK_00335 [Pseudooceanicola sp.]
MENGRGKKMRIGGFGHGLPHGLFAALGIAVEDVTLAPPPSGATPVDGFLEPFMDPFSAAFLRRLGAGALDTFDLLIVLRESPGAVHAFHYAREFARRALLTDTAPELHLLNLLLADDAPARRFNEAEIERLRERTGPSPPLPPPAIAPARVPDEGPGIALLGAPMGNRRLHALIARHGRLVFDQQAANDRAAAGGTDVRSALAAQAANPFAPRHPRDLYLPAVAGMLDSTGPDRLLWQVDPNDDLWGWLAPEVAALCAGRGVAFTDLGFLPRWPEEAELAPVAALLGQTA